MIFSYLLACWAWGGEVEKFVEAAEKKHGEFGEKAATFLVEGMPKGDRENLGDLLTIESIHQMALFQSQLFYSVHLEPYVIHR